MSGNARRPVRHSFEVMGTVASIAVAPADGERLGSEAIATALMSAEALLHELDLRFSHYRDDSGISRWQRGEAIDDVTRREIGHVLAACDSLARESGGVFASRNPRTGELDTAGFVKGHAIARAADLLRGHGLENALVGVGGDVQGMGTAEPERPWRVAIEDPRSSSAVAALVDVTNRAVATSGRAQRGDHLWSLTWDGSRLADSETIGSFTVIGPDIERADAYATVGYAMGPDGPSWVAGHEGYRSVVVHGDGSILTDADLITPH